VILERRSDRAGWATFLLPKLGVTVTSGIFSRRCDVTVTQDKRNRRIRYSLNISFIISSEIDDRQLSVPRSDRLYASDTFYSPKFAREMHSGDREGKFAPKNKCSNVKQIAE